MRHAVFLRWDSWAEHTVRHEVDVIHCKTVVTFTAIESRQNQHAKRFPDKRNNLVGFIEPTSGQGLFARFSGMRCRITNATSWVTVSVTNTDGTSAAEGSYTFGLGLVVALKNNCGCRRVRDPTQTCRGQHLYILQLNTKLGVGVTTLVKSDLENAQVTPTPSEIINAVSAETTPTDQTREPPETGLASLDDDQQIWTTTSRSGRRPASLDDDQLVWTTTSKQPSRDYGNG